MEGSPGDVVAIATGISILGLVLGLLLFIRGLLAYLRAQRIGGIESSPVSAIAAGEVRITGTVEPVDSLLVSPLQSEKCVWYRAHVEESSGRSSRTVLDEARAVGFRVKDASGVIRVFPRGAKFTAPNDLDEKGGSFGSGTAGVRINTGPTLVGVVDADDREAQIAELLTVRRPTAGGGPAGLTDGGSGLATFAGIGFAGVGGTRRYTEARIAPGDTVTVIGWALPFGSLDDPASADASLLADSVLPPDDPALLADLAAARAAGTLEANAEDAWGNAAIPGFGIGRPVRPPELDPGVDARPVDPEEQKAREALAARAERRYEIAENELVLAAGEGMALAVYDGSPAVAAGREQDRFLLGLVGAAVAIVSAIVLAFLVRGGGIS